MRKKKLDTVYHYDFELIGLISSVKSHKIAWEISSLLNVRLLRKPDLVVHFDKKSIESYTHFATENEFHELHLFKNYPHNIGTNRAVKYLAPEYNYVDYILMSQGVNRADIKQTKQHLQHAMSIEMLIFIPLKKLKAKELFIF